MTKAHVVGEQIFTLLNPTEDTGRITVDHDEATTAMAVRNMTVTRMIAEDVMMDTDLIMDHDDAIMMTHTKTATAVGMEDGAIDTTTIGRIAITKAGTDTEIEDLDMTDDAVGDVVVLAGRRRLVNCSWLMVSRSLRKRVRNCYRNSS
jgi:hypothetical protein